ncbi:MAG: ABC transporter permease subunit [Acidimicrobiia bacterium]
MGRSDFGPVELGLLYGLLYGFWSAALVVRSRALSVMQKPFVEAARAAGGSPPWIITTHLVPHLLPYVAVQVMAGVTGALITQGFIEFHGAAETRIGLGSLVYLGLTYQAVLTTSVAWTTLMAGAISISLMAASFYLMSVGLREAIDPKLRAERG